MNRELRQAISAEALPSPPFARQTCTGRRQRSSWRPADESRSTITSTPSSRTSGAQVEPGTNGRCWNPPRNVSSRQAAAIEKQTNYLRKAKAQRIKSPESVNIMQPKQTRDQQ